MCGVWPPFLPPKRTQVAAEAADRELAAQGKKSDRLDPKACEHLQALAHERLYRDVVRKDAQLCINNQRLRIYFRINNLNQVKHLIQSAEDMLAQVLDRSPAAEAVYFKWALDRGWGRFLDGERAILLVPRHKRRFFCGRLAVLQENYPKAVADLTYALKRCHREAQEQQK